MALARFKALCMDAVDPGLLGAFWAEVTGLSWEGDADGEGTLRGPTPQHTIWVNRVPEPKSVKHRVHLDVYARRLLDLEALGSPAILPEGDGRRWTVMTDPEGGEYCAFLRSDLPAYRVHGLVVDSADPEAQGQWWAQVYGVDVVHQFPGAATLCDVPGMPIETMDFVPVPEPKAAKNRIHWDVLTSDPQGLIDAGATVLRAPDGQIRWHVLADPEGNEFCAFTE